MSRYLLIENPGVAPQEAFTLLGASNKAGTEAIGQFGSGTKFGVLALLRDNLNPVIFCGNLRIEFRTKQINFDGADHQQLQVKFTGKDNAGKQVNRTEDLSVVLQYGKIDWTDVRLAAREYVSNALDAVNGDSTQVSVKIVDKEPRAKAGTTRVYVPVDENGKLEDFVDNLGDWFLHFSGKVWRNTAILEKDTPGCPRIYRRGVFVREVKYADNALYNYNLNDLPLDEARVANDYTVKSAAGRAIRNCLNANIYAKIILSGKSWEGTFDLAGEWEYVDSATIAARQKAWSEAQDIVLGTRGVFLTENADNSGVVGKGYTPQIVSNEVYEAVKKFKLRSPESILTVDEREGRRVDKVTDSRIVAAVTKVWCDLEVIGATRGEALPAIKSYDEQLQGEKRTFGLWKDDTVYINKCLIAGDKFSPEYYAVCLEELAHHITKATDNSRDFQEFFIQLATRLLLK